MDNLRMIADADFREGLINYVKDMDLKSAFERRYGRRGWQRKLGAVLDVPETTVNGWFKPGKKIPVLAKLAFGVLLSRSLRPPRSWIPIKNGASYSVCDTQGPVGRIVADNISSLDDAALLAAAPQLYKAGGAAFVVFNDARDFMDGWGELADNLGAGLDAATLNQSGEEDEERQEDLAMELSSRLGEESMKKSSGKFDNLARLRVIDAVHEHFDVTLKRVGRRQKWLRDESGRNWWVLGGKDDWHGIPEDMMEHEEQTHIEGRLVIAQLKREVIEAFWGRLGPFVNARNEFSRAAQQTGADQYQFMVRLRGACLRIEKTNVELERFARIPYSDEDKQKDKKIHELKKLAAAMSPEQRAALRDRLQGIQGA